MQNKNNIHFWFGDDSFSMQEILRSEKISVLENNGNADVCDLDFAAAESRYDMENKVKESLRGNSLFAELGANISPVDTECR